MLTLPSELTHRQASACLRWLLQELKSQADDVPVVIDAGALTSFDSCALAVLLECRRAAILQGRGFAVAALPPALAKLGSLYGVQELLPSVSSINALRVGEK